VTQLFAATASPPLFQERSRHCVEPCGSKLTRTTTSTRPPIVDAIFTGLDDPEASLIQITWIGDFGDGLTIVLDFESIVVKIDLDLVTVAVESVSRHLSVRKKSHPSRAVST
jgi:hypothetical protein